MNNLTCMTAEQWMGLSAKDRTDYIVKLNRNYRQSKTEIASLFHRSSKWLTDQMNILRAAGYEIKLYSYMADSGLTTDEELREKWFGFLRGDLDIDGDPTRALPVSSPELNTATARTKSYPVITSLNLHGTLPELMACLNSLSSSPSVSYRLTLDAVLSGGVLG